MEEIVEVESCRREEIVELGRCRGFYTPESENSLDPSYSGSSIMPKEQYSVMLRITSLLKYSYTMCI